MEKFYVLDVAKPISSSIMCWVNVFASVAFIFTVQMIHVAKNVEIRSKPEMKTAMMEI
jgi:hypothetical protein